MYRSPFAGKLDGVRLSLSFLSHDDFLKKPAAASAFAVVPNSHPLNLTDGNGLDDELVQLRTAQHNSGINTWFQRHKLGYSNSQPLRF